MTNRTVIFQRIALSLASCSLAALCAPAFGQANIPAPPTREEIQPPVAPAAAPPARLSVEGDIERAPCPLSDPAYANIRVKVSEVQFNNLGPVDPAELASSYAPYLGTDQPISILCDIRDSAATLLRRKGYLAAVQVPTQRIDNGVIKLEVLYARLTAIRVRGDAGAGERLVAQYLERLTQDPVFNQRTAERYLLLARDLPGYDVRLSLIPAGTAPGELIGEVTVRRTAFELDFNAQNLADSSAGPYGGQLRVQFYGLTGMGDRTYISAYTTHDFDEQQIVQAGHEFRVGSEGLMLAGRLTYAWTKPDVGAGVVGRVKADTFLATVEARYPFVRSQALSIWGAAGLDYLNQDIDFIGPLSKDKLRIAYAQVNAEAIDLKSGAKPRWRATGTLELRQGLDIFGASEACKLVCAAVRTPTSRADGDPTATLIRGEAAAELSLGESFSFFLRTRGQLAFDRVLSFEEYSGGNYTIGRGYDPGTIVGDDGIGVQAELRGPQITPFAKVDFSFQPFVFADLAWAYDEGRPGDPQKLASVGGGMRTRLNDRFRLDLTLAVPTRQAGLLAKTPDPRLLFTFTTALLPWGDR